MYKADYHTHSRFSFDGKEEIDAMCRAAIKAGLDEIAVTDHMDIFTDLPYGEGKLFDDGQESRYTTDTADLARQLAAAKEKYAGRLVVTAGIELGQPQVNPDQARQFLEDFQPEFVIGSVHNMEKDLDVYYYDFTDIDLTALYDHYLDWLLELARTGDFDVMGHLTYPLRYAFERRGMRMDTAPFEEKFRALFRILIERGKGIELNVSGLFRPMRETMPPLYVLKLYKSCGGEIITIGSDAHDAVNIGAYQDEARYMLAAAGFKAITLYRKRQPRFVDL